MQGILQWRAFLHKNKCDKGILPLKRLKSIILSRKADEKEEVKHRLVKGSRSRGLLNKQMKNKRLTKVRTYMCTILL